MRGAVAYAYDSWDEEELPPEPEQHDEEPFDDANEVVIEAEVVNYRQSVSHLYQQTQETVSWTSSFDFGSERQFDNFLARVKTVQPVKQRKSVAWENYINSKTLTGLGIVACLALLLLLNPLSWFNKGHTSTSEYFVDAKGGTINPALVKVAESGPVATDVSNRTVSLVLGTPSISPDNIDRVLRQYNSPATGIGQAMYNLGVKYGIDPAYALAFFIKESSAGTAGVAVQTKSIGNIRCTPSYQCYYTQGNGSFRKYNTWEAGAEDWFVLIKDLYIGKWGLNTVEKILPVYAPAADKNNPTAYASAVNRLVDNWRKGVF
jgi:Mannosyl-glycoprotein endo-beta-N-acetylglucosaminidase